MGWIWNASGSGGSGGTGLSVNDAIVSIGHPADAPNSRAITSGSGISVTDNGAGSTVVISATGGGSGTVTGGSNASQSGSAVLDTANSTSANLLFNEIKANSSKIAVTGGGNATAVSIDVNQSNLSIANTQITGVTLTSGTLAGSVSGTNTGDQTITLTGDVTGSGSGSFGATIGSNKVTYAKMQQASTVTLLGNPTGSTANVEEITLGSGLSFSGTTLTASGSSGTVTGGTSANGTAAVFDSANSTSTTLHFNGASAGTNLNIAGGGSNTAISYSWTGSPMTTEGDIIYYHSSAATRLAIGTVNTILTSNGTDPAYTSPIAQTSLAFGSSPINNKQFTITDSRVSTTTKIIVSRGYNNDVDELDMDPMIFSAVPANGTFTLSARTMDGPVVGTYYADYILG